MFVSVGSVCTFGGIGTEKKLGGLARTRKPLPLMGAVSEHRRILEVSRRNQKSFRERVLAEVCYVIIYRCMC